jgi:catechol 2,3-dioxygenase-like lactoylglutathione lyase family enzyme
MKVYLSLRKARQMLKITLFYPVIAAVLGLPTLLAARQPPSRPPITGIANVSVYASNPARSQHFYGDLLGFPESGAQLYRVNSLQSIRVDPLPHGVANHLESVAFATPNVDALRRYLLGRHVEVPEKVQTEAGGVRILWVKDPEGHRIEFVQAAAQEHPMAAATPTHEIQASRHILHAGFIVHNRAAEDRFYRDVLGFHQAWQGGMKDEIIDWVDMQVPNGSDWIEYMLHGPAPPSASESGVLNHFALGVPSMQPAAEFLKQRGRPSTHREQPQVGRDGKWQLNLYDPDGTRVELMEFRPVRTPCCSRYTLPARP